MKSATTRQKALLAVLGVVLLFALWQLVAPGDEADLAAGSRPAVSDGEDGEDSASARRMSARQRRARDEEERTDEVVDLRLAALDLVPRDYAPGRDPWRFREPPPPPPPPAEPRVVPPPGPSPEELERQRQQLLEQQRLAAEAAASQPPPKPQPPIFPYKYIGYIGPPGRRVAVFTDGKVTINRLEGEVLDGKFLVAQIGYESVEIQFIGFPDTSQRVAVGR